MVRRVKHSDKESCANSPSPHKRMSFPLAYKYQVPSHIRCVAAVDHFSLAYQSLSHSRQTLSYHTTVTPFRLQLPTTKMFRRESTPASELGN